MMTIPETPGIEITADELFAQKVTVEACAAASEDFETLWAGGRMKPGGTLERDRNLFVLGATYGLAWAMKNLTWSGDDVELVRDDAPAPQLKPEEGGG